MLIMSKYQKVKLTPREIEPDDLFIHCPSDHKDKDLLYECSKIWQSVNWNNP